MEKIIVQFFNSSAVKPSMLNLSILPGNFPISLGTSELSTPACILDKASSLKYSFSFYMAITRLTVPRYKLCIGSIIAKEIVS